jgi:subtilase family serine protease
MIVRLSSWFRSGLRVFSPHAFQRASLAACLLASGIPSYAQRVAARIVAPVDESTPVTLKGNVHPLARPEFDQGAVPASTPLTRVQLVLKRSAQQEAALEAYLASAQQPNSPNYHKWVTPEQFGSLYGPADADIQKLTTWLHGHGFTVNNVSKGKISIDFSGTAAQAGDAFHVEIHSFNANGKQFNANTTDPQIPAAFAPVVSGVAHLHTDGPKPLNVPGRGGHYDPSLKRFVPESSVTPAAGSAPHPNLTGISPNNATQPWLFLTPADAATIYNTPNSLNAKFSGGSSYDGAKVTIGIAGTSNIDPSIVANYRSLLLHDTTDISKVLTVDDPNKVGEVQAGQQALEIYMDAELSGGLAPGALLHLYVASDVNAAAAQAVDANMVDILSVSYGVCEQINGAAVNLQISNMWKQAAAQGITVFVSTGDAGSADCDDSRRIPLNTSAAFGLSVNGFASTPYNIAVGGTDYSLTPANFSTYVSAPDLGASGYYRSVKDYIPESTWNDSTMKNGDFADNAPWPTPTTDNPWPQNGYRWYANTSAGEGGVSSCATLDENGNCTGGYPKPSWQTSPVAMTRAVPDISLLGASGLNQATWLICDSLLNAAGTAKNCAPPFTVLTFDNSGGSSAAAPALAGIFAAVVQKTGQRQGQAAPTLYSLFYGANGQTIFHDITVGNNSVPCYAGSKDCNTTNNYLLGYNASKGYDLATGLGSVDATQLVENWPAPGSSSMPPVGTTIPTVNVTLSSAMITPGDSVTLTATVAGPSGSQPPTGTVTFSTDASNVAKPNPATGSNTLGMATLNGGSASFTVPASTLLVGTVSITTTYTPDTASSGTYFSGIAPSTSLAVLLGEFTVTGSSVTLTGAPASGSSTITVRAAEGFATAGQVDLLCTLTGMPANANPAYYPTCTLAQPSVQVSSATPGTVTATISTTATATAALSHNHSGPFGSPWSNAGGLTLAGTLLLIFPRRRAGRTILALLVGMVILAGTGCGSSSSNLPPTAPGTTPGTYSFTIVGNLDNSPASLPVAAGVAVTVN